MDYVPQMREVSEQIMIKAGIKIGPYNWVERLINSEAECCEVWFLTSREVDYTDMFQFLARKQIRTCLHFRGLVENNSLADPASPDEDLRKKSILLIQKCIDIASRNGFSYVNIQPGSHLSEKTNAGLVAGIGDSAVMHQKVRRAFRESAVFLHDYGQEHNVNVLWETPPGEMPAYLINSFVIERIAKRDGILLTNNISHIMAECQGRSKEAVINYLFQRTARLAPDTRLLHFNIHPSAFNGRSGIGGAADPGMEHFFTRERLVQFLRLLEHGKEVLAVNDPGEQYEQNYIAFKYLLAKSGGNGFLKCAGY